MKMSMSLPLWTVAHSGRGLVASTPQGESALLGLLLSSFFIYGLIKPATNPISVAGQFNGNSKANTKTPSGFS